MSDTADNKLSSLLKPSARISGWLFILSMWGLALWLLNILHMATPTGDKVVWGSILSIGLVGGDYISSNPDFRPFSDGIFLIICLIGTFLGSNGLMSNVEGGIKGWLMGIKETFWPSLVDTTTVGGLRKTISVWLMLIGIGFYVVTGIMHQGWVDPGVYSVTAPFIVSGWALGKLADAQSVEFTED